MKRRIILNPPPPVNLFAVRTFLVVGKGNLFNGFKETNPYASSLFSVFLSFYYVMVVEA